MEENKLPSPEKNGQYYGVFSFIYEIAKIILLALIIIVPIRMFLFQPFFVQGASMEPNFEDSEYLIINEFGFKEASLGSGQDRFVLMSPFKSIGRQEVVVFRYPKIPSQFFIKRTIGLPGEKVAIKDNYVTIFNKQHPDGFILDESVYLQDSVQTNGNIVVQLKDDEYFVMGDNRMFSSDSRSWGPVKKNEMVGKVLIRAWPFNRVKAF